MSVTDDNKELVRRYFDERWNHSNYDVIDELVASAEDIADAKEGLAYLEAAFGDIKMTVSDLTAEDDRVAVRWQSSGIHQGEYLGVAPSGERVTFEGLALLRIADGKIVEDVAYGDNAVVLLGLEW